MAVFNNVLAGASGQTTGAAGYQIERSLRFNSSDSAYLSRTPASAGNRKTWTWAGWMKRTASTYSGLFSVNGSDNATLFEARFENDTFRIAASSVLWRATTQVFRDPSSWGHLVISVDTTQAAANNRIRLYWNGDEITTFTTTNNPAQNSDLGVNRTGAHYIGAGWTSGDPFNGYLADIHFIDGQALDPTSFTEVDATTGQLIPIAYSGSYGTNGFHLPFSDNSTAAALGTDTSGNGNDWTVNNISVAEGNGNWISATSLTAGTFYPGRDVIANIYNGLVANNGSPFDQFLEFASFPATLTFNPAITSSSGNVKIWIGSYYGASSYQVTLNGSTSYTFTSIPSEPNPAVLYDLGVTTLSSITFPTGAAAMRVMGIVANGVLLSDYSFGQNNDSLVDTPTNYGTDTGAGGEVRGNYATLNPLALGSQVTIANGNLDVTAVVAGSGKEFYSTLGISSGKWYTEFTLTGTTCMVGVSNALVFSSYFGSQASQYGYYHTGVTYNNGSSSSYGDSLTTGDVVGIAFDADNGNLYFYKNGTIQNSGTAAFTGLTSGPYFFGGGESGGTGYCNFGQRPFAYTAPSGYKALCTQNLDDPLVAKPSTVMDVATDTGANILTAAQGAIGGSADLLWIKDRANANNHQLIDTVRGGTLTLQSNTTAAETTYSAPSGSSVAWTWDAGTSNTSVTAGSLNSSVYDQSQTWSNSATLTGSIYTGAGDKTKMFDGTDATAGPDLGSYIDFTPSTAIPINSSLRIKANVSNTAVDAIFQINNSNVSTVATGFPASGGVINNATTWTTIANPPSSLSHLRFGWESAGSWMSLAGIEIDGKILVDSGVSVTNVPSIASTVRANPSAGFSIVSYDGSASSGRFTVGHGLNAAPAFVITKSRTTAGAWAVYTTALGNNSNWFILNTTDAVGSGTDFVYLQNSVLDIIYNSYAAESASMIAYCFAPVDGYSSFGSYTGNGSTDGPFVYTGFRPRWLLVKNGSTTSSWVLHDTTRSTYNISGAELLPNSSGAEYSYDRFDILSNGFKNRTTNNASNTSGNTYIYAAFAENPFKYARAR